MTLAVAFIIPDAPKPEPSPREERPTDKLVEGLPPLVAMRVILAYHAGYEAGIAAMFKKVMESKK